MVTSDGPGVRTARPVTYRGAVPDPVPLVLRVLTALAAGLVLQWSFVPGAWWWLAPTGVAALTLSVLGARARRGAALGLLSGVVYFGFTLSWSGIYVGVLPWAALALLQALYLGLTAALIAGIATPWWRRGHHGAALFVTPAAWVLGELLRSTTPYGGFPWARLAFTQVDGPLLAVARYAGAPGVSFTVALLGAAMAQGVLAVQRRQVGRPLAGAVALVIAVPLATMLLPRPTDGPSAPVALVQGNVPRPGLDFNAERRAVLDNHVAGTLAVAQDVAAGRQERPDLVIWPENASDIDPLRNPDAGEVIASAVDAVQVPVLVGAVLSEPEPYLSNASLLYRPGQATPQRYVKQHPVPFAEYIPQRELFRLFSDKVDLVTRDFVAGQRPVAFDIDGADGLSWAAVPTICFEVAYDTLVRDSLLLAQGQPSLIIVQTNNATFGFTDESEQQFAISRLRAVEHGRAVAHVSTVGVSGLIAADGTPGRVTELFTADQVAGRVTLRSEITPSDRIGRAPEIVIGLALVILAVGARRALTADRLEAAALAPSRRDPAGG